MRDDLSFDLSFDKFTLKNLSGHWLGLQTLAVNVSVAAKVLPIRGIVLSAFHKGPLICYWPCTPCFSQCSYNTSLCIRGGDPFQLPFSIPVRHSGV